MDDNETDEIAPRKQTLFPVTADDIVDNALQNLDEKQAREVTRKAADEVVRIAVEKRKAEYRSDAAQDEMRNLIDNANLLDRRGGDYKINSTFETATGTTNVEIQKSKSTTMILIAIVVGLIIALAVLATLLFK
jgi:hypothetical protein